MRKIAKLAGTGALFLCVGGWVYSGSVKGADPAKEALDKAVVAASQPAAAAVNDPQMKVDAGGNIDFTCQDLDVTTALHLLSLQTKRNIIASKEVKGTVTAMLHNVTFTEALNALLLPNGFGYVEKGSFIFVYTAEELAKQQAKDRKVVNKIYRLHYVQSKDMAALIKPLMSSAGLIAMTPDAVPGLPDSAVDTGGKGYATDDTLVISDYAENLAEIDKAMIELDVRPKQVLLESTILRATLTEDNALGVDLISLSGLNFGNLIGGAISNNINSSLAPAAGQTVIGAGANPQANIGTNFASKVPAGGLSIGLLSNHVSVFVRALEETTDVTICANPKILALNKHKGEVFIGDQFGYRTTTTTTTTTQETVQFLDTGTKLVFRPDIGLDGWVRLEVHPEDSSGGLNNGLPTKQSTQVTSNLNCKDGRTVVIGGLFRTQGTAGRGQVPILGNIPVLGPAFRRTNDQQQKSETIVLLTPHIINDDTTLYEKSQQAAADVNRMVMGNRAGLQPWGRERIAQLWYGKAQDSLDAGDTEKAKMYTDWALNSNPRFIEAIRMREKLTGQRVAEADGSAIKDFVKEHLKEKPDTGSSYFPNPKPVVPATAPATAPAGK
jgi:type II secretory pathway component GspD/PulD (secretin)